MVDDCLLKDCELALTETSFNIRCPSHLVALGLKQATKDLAKWALSFKKNAVLVFSPDYPNPFHISASMAEDNAEEPGITANSDNTIIMPLSLQIDLNAAYNSELPEYVTSLKTATVLWFNPAAMVANQKTFEQFQGFNAALLSDANELTKRYEILGKSESLREYEYIGYRWFFDEDNQIYLRKQMNFMSRFEPVSDFYNEVCYHSVILEARETGVIFR